MENLEGIKNAALICEKLASLLAVLPTNNNKYFEGWHIMTRAKEYLEKQAESARRRLSR